MNYTPVFDNGFFVTFKGMFAAPINPVYCLDEVSVTGLISQLLSFSPTEVHQFPLGAFGPGSPFIQSGLVPYLRFNIQGGGTVDINAGLLANYWNHGYSEEYALSQCIADLKTNWGVV